MAKINVTCPQCQTKYRVEESHVGKKARCKKCGTTFPVLFMDSGPMAIAADDQAAEKVSNGLPDLSEMGKGHLFEVFGLATGLIRAAAAMSAASDEGQLRANSLGLIQETASTLGINVPSSLMQLSLGQFGSCTDLRALKEALRVKFGERVAAVFEIGVYTNIAAFTEPRAAKALLDKAIELCDVTSREGCSLIGSLIDLDGWCHAYDSGTIDQAGFQKGANMILGKINTTLQHLDATP